MVTKTTVYPVSFEGVLRGRPPQLHLHFPGRFGGYFGPYLNRDAAWAYYVRVVRECYFRFEPEKTFDYEETVVVLSPVMREWSGYEI